MKKQTMYQLFIEIYKMLRNDAYSAKIEGGNLIIFPPTNTKSDVITISIPEHQHNFYVAAVHHNGECVVLHKQEYATLYIVKQNKNEQIYVEFGKKIFTIC